MNSVRLWYKKSGLAIYTSHLDMNRCFTRAVRMAGIPLWYTEGFNPHPYLNFLLPLPLGTGAEKDPIDIRITEDISFDEIKSRLNAVLPGGIEIVAVTEPAIKVSEVAKAGYEIILEFLTPEEACAFAAGALAVIESGELNAEKRSKRGIKTVNLCNFISSFDASSEGSRVKIKAVISAGPAENLNAALLADSLLKEFGASAEKTEITRTEIYTADGKIFI